MTHLDPELLYTLVFDSKPLESAAEQHLSACAACRQAVADLRVLAQELAFLRKSDPSPAALDRYYASFAHVQQQPSRLGAVWRSVTAMLTWDSRQQLAMQGVRSVAGSTAFRLLYVAGQAEVELLIEPEGQLFRAQGEIIAGDGPDAVDTPLAPALIQWTDAQGNVRYETESDASGRFSLRNIVPGTYRLSIVSAARDIIEIEALEIM